MVKELRTAIFFIFVSSCAWASAGFLTFAPIILLLMFDYVPINLLAALIIGGGIASIGYLPASERTLRDGKFLATLGVVWAVGWVIGSIAVSISLSDYVFKFLVQQATWYQRMPPLPPKVLEEVVATLPRYAVFGGAIGGLVVGIGQWLVTRHTLRLSWLLVPAAIIGWAAGWWVLASMYADLALGIASGLLGLESLFWFSRAAFAGGVAGLSSGLVIAFLPRLGALPQPAQNHYRGGS